MPAIKGLFTGLLLASLFLGLDVPRAEATRAVTAMAPQETRVEQGAAQQRPGFRSRLWNGLKNTFGKNKLKIAASFIAGGLGMALAHGHWGHVISHGVAHAAGHTAAHSVMWGLGVAMPWLLIGGVLAYFTYKMVRYALDKRNDHEVESPAAAQEGQQELLVRRPNTGGNLSASSTVEQTPQQQAILQAIRNEEQQQQQAAVQQQLLQQQMQQNLQTPMTSQGQ